MVFQLEGIRRPWLWVAAWVLQRLRVVSSGQPGSTQTCMARVLQEGLGDEDEDDREDGDDDGAFDAHGVSLWVMAWRRSRRVSMSCQQATGFAVPVPSW